MKNSFYLTALATCALFCAAAQAEDNIIYNSWRDVGYVKTTNWECAQGLCTDGIYYYYAGHNDRTKENADIHKIRVFDNKEVAVFSRKGPMHSAELLWYIPHDSILGCSGGNGRKPFVWEVDKNNGNTLNKWDFEGMGENGGALIAWIADDDIIVFTSSQDGARVAFTKVTLQPEGKFIDHGTWSYSKTDLGVPQGMDYRDAMRGDPPRARSVAGIGAFRITEPAGDAKRCFASPAESRARKCRTHKKPPPRHDQTGTDAENGERW